MRPHVYEDGGQMKSEIVGYDMDEEGDRVALLACGHTRHVRHDPPFVYREWVTSEEGRRKYLGVELDCVKCENDEAREHDRGV